MNKDSNYIRFIEKLIKLIANVFTFGILLFILLAFIICLGVYIRSYPQIVSLFEFIWIIPTIFIIYVIIKLAKY